MEKIINLHIEKLPEGYYLATTDDLQGLVVQGKTITETLEIARDVAQKLLESQTDTTLIPIAESFDYPLVRSPLQKIWCNQKQS
ncbi:type II toxin-antitoxin system HicB family antitoxin [Pleurocapsales cyanobacterium LEGE 06147]|nr:type II toxin-antitoxin system HicB family antitoxin [Pleurocapsales cyanobacterium LEGE 06147]